jgi:hemolysin III
VDGLKHYTAQEEKANIISHMVGLVFSLAALVLMITRAYLYGDVWHVLSVSIFGASLIALYMASTLYHSAKDSKRRTRLRILDHATIYILIAGTYTPYSLVVLHGMTGWTIFIVSWAMALTGIILKLFFTGKYDVISTLMYIFMGWIIIFAITPLINSLSAEGLFWLVAGGVAYTTGAILYSIKKIKFNHAIFHVFVLLGSFCHFVSVYFYVLPAEKLSLN